MMLLRSDKIGLEFIDLYRLFKTELNAEQDRIDDLPGTQNKKLTDVERIEANVNALLKVIDANNKQILKDLQK